MVGEAPRYKLAIDKLACFPKFWRKAPKKPSYNTTFLRPFASTNEYSNMGRELQKSKNKSSIPRKRQKGPSKKKILQNPIIAKHWYGHRTFRCKAS